MVLLYAVPILKTQDKGGIKLSALRRVLVLRHVIVNGRRAQLALVAQLDSLGRPYSKRKGNSNSHPPLSSFSVLLRTFAFVDERFQLIGSRAGYRLINI